jgi:hypothetical protein
MAFTQLNAPRDPKVIVQCGVSSEGVSPNAKWTIVAGLAIAIRVRSCGDVVKESGTECGDGRKTEISKQPAEQRVARRRHKDSAKRNSVALVLKRIAAIVARIELILRKGDIEDRIRNEID